MPAVATFALVDGSRPLYETKAVLIAPSPPLLDRYDSLTALGTQPAPEPIDPALNRHDLGDVAAVAATVRRRLKLRNDRGTLDVSIDVYAGNQVTIVARHASAQKSRRLADGVAAGILAQRTELVATRLGAARTELGLVRTLAVRSPSAASRARLLRDRIAGLVQLRATPGAGIDLLQRAAIPTRPVAPRVARDVVFAALLGMLVAVSLRALTRGARARPSIASGSFPDEARRDGQEFAARQMRS